jgi:2-polyprenyl-6-methoxyphenol hydroxylase-like FAD-dependent oxidoreductase
MSNFHHQRAVVIGAGIGGLAAAGALAGYFGQVDVLDRDQIPQSVASRPGTPQDRHSHGLLAGGLEALGAIYPGIEHDLEQAGAVRARVALDVRYERSDVGTLPQRDLGRSLLCATRPLIESVVRRRAQARSNVRLHCGCRVTEILPAWSDAATPSVRFEGKSGRKETLAAGLVVDASGRGGLTLRLLDALGWKHPEVTEVGVDLSYATVVVRIPDDAPKEWKLVLTQPDPPALARHAVLIPVEGNRWTVTVAEHGGGSGPDSWEEFLEVARGLATPTVYNALRHADPPDGIRHYAFPASQWCHFERMPRLPSGVLPIADALCRFNPIHGQGMSSAAKQAHRLLQVLRQTAAEAAPVTAVQTRFMADVASILQTPWTMSTSADLAFPGTRGERPANFEDARQFEAALFRAAVADPVVHRCVMDVAQLLLPDSILQEPDIQRRIEAASAQVAA